MQLQLTEHANYLKHNSKRTHKPFLHFYVKKNNSRFFLSLLIFRKEESVTKKI